MKQQGIIKLIVIIIIAVLVLSYFGINIKNVAESDVGRSNFGYVGELTAKLWTWLVGLWHQFVTPYLGKVPKVF
jgi:uncharacterized membrane protein